jgi:hypothetical protein
MGDRCALGRVRSTSRRTSTRPAFALACVCGLAMPVATAWGQFPQFTIQRIGLFDQEHTSATGTQEAVAVGFLNAMSASGTVIGQSSRYAGNTPIGQSAWVWNGSATISIGLEDQEHTATDGTQNHVPLIQNAHGQIIGVSARFTPSGNAIGSSLWTFDGVTTHEIGLTGPEFTAPDGRRVSRYTNAFPPFLIRPINAAGHVIGFATRFSSSGSETGTSAWAWNGTTTQEIGLFGPGYGGTSTNPLGNARNSLPRSQSDTGLVAGISERYTESGAYLGQDAWIWNGTVTQAIGLTGPQYTTSAGLGYQAPITQNRAGQVAGQVARLAPTGEDLGIDSWVWNVGSVQQVGLTGPGYVSGAGRQSSVIQLQNEAGQVAGRSSRFAADGTALGTDAWVWRNGVTQRVGLDGVDHNASTGTRQSLALAQNEAGLVAGISDRYTPSGQGNGRDVWGWNGVQTQQIGLTGAAYTGSAGWRDGFVSEGATAAGTFVGGSYRVSGVNTRNGQDAWVWDGAITRQVGLVGGIYTGTGGFQESSISTSNAAGILAGRSLRITGVNSNLGQDTWYFDPATGTSVPVIGSVRTSDNYANSTAWFLSDDGFLMGTYSFFAGGVGVGENRSFIFRPDLGFADLGNLLSGTLAAGGWDSLSGFGWGSGWPTALGVGSVIGQPNNGCIFILGTIPSPGAAMVLGLAGVVATRPRRGCG